MDNYPQNSIELTGLYRSYHKSVPENRYLDFTEASIRLQQGGYQNSGECLASVSAYYGLKLPIARIRQYAGTDRKGTNVLGLVEAAQKIGFQAKGVKGSWESLSKIL